MRRGSPPDVWGRATLPLGAIRVFIFLGSLYCAVKLYYYEDPTATDCMSKAYAGLAGILLGLTVSLPSAVMACGILGRTIWSAWLAVIGDVIFVLIILLIGQFLPKRLAYVVCGLLIAYTACEWELALRFLRSRPRDRRQPL